MSITYEYVVNAVKRLCDEYGVCVEVNKELYEKLRRGHGIAKIVCVKYLLHLGLDAEVIAPLCGVGVRYVRIVESMMRSRQ